MIMALTIKQSIDNLCDKYASSIDIISKDLSAVKDFVEYMNEILKPKIPILIFSKGVPQVYYKRDDSVIDAQFQRRYS